MSEEIKEAFNTITTIYINDKPVQVKLPSALQDSVIRKIDGKYYVEYGILDYIEHLQQKVEELEKENKELKQPQVFIDCEDMEERYGRDLYEDYLKGKIEQLENIRKEAIEFMTYVSRNIGGLKDKWLIPIIDEKINILNKGSDKE